MHIDASPSQPSVTPRLNTSVTQAAAGVPVNTATQTIVQIVFLMERAARHALTHGATCLDGSQLGPSACLHASVIRADHTYARTAA